MTKTELLAQLADLPDDEELVIKTEYHNDKITITTQAGYWENRRQEEIAWYEEQVLALCLDKSFAQADFDTAQAKLAKRETKKWRTILNRAENKLNRLTRDIERTAKWGQAYTDATWEMVRDGKVRI